MLKAHWALRNGGASTIIAVDTVRERMKISKQVGADVVIDFNTTDPADEIMKLTGGRGVEVAIEALGLQSTFESCVWSQHRVS